MRLVIAVLYALGVTAALQLAADDETPTPGSGVYAVIDRRVDVLATDGLHLFRSRRLGFEHSPWRYVPTPPEMGFAGAFVLPPIGAGEREKQPSHVVMFYTIKENDVGAPDDGSRKYGLFVSEDDGNHWKLANDGWIFNKIARLEDGKLFALAEPLSAAKQPEPPPGKTERKVRILESGDSGVTWKDVTANGIELLEKDGATDPDEILAALADEPGRVCVSGFNTMGDYALFPLAPPEQGWKRMPKVVWAALHMTAERFFQPFTSGFDMKDRASRPMLATFDEYFKFRYVNRISIETFALVPEKDEYEFAWHTPMPVKVAAEFRKKGEKLTLMDLADGSEFWGARVITPKGKRVTIPSAAMKRGGDPKQKDASKATLAEYLARPDLRRVDLTRGKLYTREIDIAKCIPFPGPGVYKVQLTYTCPQWQGDGGNAWCGEFGDRAITVTVK